MPGDITKLSDMQLDSLIGQAQNVGKIQNIETGGKVPDTAVMVNPASGAMGSMQVMPRTAVDPGFGIKPSNGTPADNARLGREYYAKLTEVFGSPETAAIAYDMGPGATHKWIKAGSDISKLPNETLDYLIKFKGGKVPKTVGPPAGTKPLGWQQKLAFEMGTKVGKESPEKAYAEAKQMPEFVPDIPGGGEALGALAKAIGFGKKAATPLQQNALAAQKLGFKIPPSQARPGAITERLEGWSNIAKLERDLSAANQPLVQNLVARDLKLPQGMQITEDSVQNVIDQGGKAYDALKNSGIQLRTDGQYQQAVNDLAKDWREASKEFSNLENPKVDALIDSMTKQVQTKRGQTAYQKVNIKSAVEFVKQMRFEAKTNFRATDAKTVALARAQMDAAEIMDNLIDKNLRAQTGNFRLYTDYKEARTLIAKGYDALNAMNKSTGNISASYFAGLLNKSKPVSGGMRDIAEVASSFPKSLQSVEKMGAQPRASAVDAIMMLMRNPALAAAMVARPGVRQLLGSNLFQTGGAETIGQITGDVLGQTGKAAAEAEGMREGE